MLDLTRCRDLLEFEFGQALEECIGPGLEPLARTLSGHVAMIRGWHASVAIHPPTEWHSPSYMLMSVAQFMLHEGGWKDAPPCENVVAVQIESFRSTPTPLNSAQAEARMLKLGWKLFRFTADEIRADVRGCAQRAYGAFLERQQRVLDEAFSEFLEWRLKCQKHPCTTLRRTPSNRQIRQPATGKPVLSRCLGWIDRWHSEEPVPASGTLVDANVETDSPKTRPTRTRRPKTSASRAPTATARKSQVQRAYGRTLGPQG